MEIIEVVGVPYFKKGSGIHIKKKNRGKFTEYCGGKVTQECINRAKKSKNPTLRKRATFAENARAWKHQEGGTLGIGGYDSSTLDARLKNLHRWTPSGGIYDPFQPFFSNENTGEENEYYKAYLGFDSAVPPMTKGAQTEWDAQIEAEKKQKGELASEFYGTTPRMDHHLQAAADTLNLGKIVRGEMSMPKDVTKKTATKMYEQAKKVMDNPGQWQQMDDYILQHNPEQLETLENNPLGMLDKYGMKWDPEKKKLYIHDTYDFPEWTYKVGFMQRRPREMKIRSAINFDPKKGSLILRDKNYKWPEIKTSY